MQDDSLMKAREKARLRACMTQAGQKPEGGAFSPDASNVFTRFSRTETDVRDPASAIRQRREAAAACHHTMCAMMLFAQLRLYGSLHVAKTAGPAAWWIAGLQLAPALALYFAMRGLLRLHPGCGLWAALEKTLGPALARAAGAVYALLLIWDGQAALYALTDLTKSYLLQETGYWALGAGAGIACALCAWSGGRYGVSRMCYLMRWILSAVLLVCAAASLTLGDVGNLSPILGPGLEKDAAYALRFSGAAWPVVLFGFVPMEAPGAPAWPRQKPGGLSFLLAAMFFATFLFFASSYIIPGGAMAQPMGWGARMVLFLRSAPWQLAWKSFLAGEILLLLLALSGCASLGARLLQGALSQRLSLAVYGLVFVAALLPLAGLHTAQGLSFLEASAPWRYPVAALPVLAGYIGYLLRKKSLKEASL